MAATWQLRVRTLVAFLLVLATPPLFACALLWALVSLVTLTHAFVPVEPLTEATPAVAAITLLATVVAVFGSFVGRTHDVFRSFDAATVPSDEYPAVEGMLSRLAAHADVPVPTLVVVPATAPNAFTAGRTGDATVVVTTALLDTLDDDQQRAILAHEIAHVANRDVAVMSGAYVLPSLTDWLVTVSKSSIRRTIGNIGAASMFTLRGAIAWAIVSVPLVLTTALVAVVFRAASTALSRVLGHYREFAADEGAVALTGDPGALASALERLDASIETTPQSDLRTGHSGIEALGVVPLGSTDGLTPTTHPPTDRRIERLRAIADE